MPNQLHRRRTRHCSHRQPSPRALFQDRDQTGGHHVSTHGDGNHLRLHWWRRSAGSAPRMTKSAREPLPTPEASIPRLDTGDMQRSVQPRRVPPANRFSAMRSRLLLCHGRCSTSCNLPPMATHPGIVPIGGTKSVFRFHQWEFGPPAAGQRPSLRPKALRARRRSQVAQGRPRRTPPPRRTAGIAVSRVRAYPGPT